MSAILYRFHCVKDAPVVPAYLQCVGAIVEEVLVVIRGTVGCVGMRFSPH